MQRDTGNTQSLTVEYGFLDSTGDDVKQLKNNYKEYAEAVVRAVTNYIDAKYVPVESPNIYIVKSGDSLYSIANKYATTVDELKKLNSLSSNILNVGQAIMLPKSTTITNDNFSYIVVSGDTLYGIANKYNVNVNDLIKYNNLSSTTLNIGQQILIPQSITEDVKECGTYIVKSGDSLYSIAKKYDTTVDNLKNINNLSSNLLSIGQELFVPTFEIVEDIMPNSFEYIVQKGDSLYSLAIKYNTTIDQIKKFNGLDTNALSIGQKLKIPKNNIDTYVVESGDSLYSIAKKYNTTISELKEKNNLTSNLLSVGQKLII